MMLSKLQDSHGDGEQYQDIRDTVGTRISSNGILERDQNKTPTQVYRA